MTNNQFSFIPTPHYPPAFLYAYHSYCKIFLLLQDQTECPWTEKSKMTIMLVISLALNLDSIQYNYTYYCQCVITLLQSFSYFGSLMCQGYVTLVLFCYVLACFWFAFEKLHFFGLEREKEAVEGIMVLYGYLLGGYKCADTN